MPARVFARLRVATEIYILLASSGDDNHYSEPSTLENGAPDAVPTLTPLFSVDGVALCLPIVIKNGLASCNGPSHCSETLVNACLAYLGGTTTLRLLVRMWVVPGLLNSPFDF